MSWSGETIQLHTEVTEQLRQNYLVSRDIHPSSHTAINKNSLPQIYSVFMHYIIAPEQKICEICEICVRIHLLCFFRHIQCHILNHGSHRHSLG